jgi:hypothetical protein
VNKHCVWQYFNVICPKDVTGIKFFYHVNTSIESRFLVLVCLHGFKSPCVCQIWICFKHGTCISHHVIYIHETIYNIYVIGENCVCYLTCRSIPGTEIRMFNRNIIEPKLKYPLLPFPFPAQQFDLWVGRLEIFFFLPTVTKISDKNVFHLQWFNQHLKSMFSNIHSASSCYV